MKCQNADFAGYCRYHSFPLRDRTYGIKCDQFGRCQPESKEHCKRYDPVKVELVEKGE